MGWPGGRHLLEAVILGLLFTLWFGLVYGGADWITGLHGRRVRIHFDTELAIPLLPVTALAYMSIYPLFWLAPFVLRTRRELRALVASLALTVFVGGVGFLLIPSEAAFPRARVSGPFANLLQFADDLNLRYNMVPSLHVALSLLCGNVYARRASGWPRILLGSWVLVIALSTLLTHQHHVVDVVTGAALGLAVARWGYPRWAASRELPRSKTVA